MRKIIVFGLILLSLGLAVQPTGQKEVQLKPKQIYKFQLESNPSTGYSWEVLQNYDHNVIEILSNKYHPKPVPRGLVGAGGIQTWQIKAIKKGKTNIVFVYKRAWEKGIDRKEVLRINVK